MEAYFSDEVLAGIKAAQKAQDRKKSRLRVHADDQRISLIKLWDDGFTVDAETTPHLRGLVDLYDSGKHLAQCLIIRSEADGRFMHYEFKRKTDISEKPPLDYARDEQKPVALLR